METLEDLIRITLAPLPARADREGWSDAQWTRHIKQLICGLGKSRDYSVCAAGFVGEYDPEWLFDVVWYKCDGEGHLAEMPLAVECEWSASRDDIQHDFEKLLVAKAALRVMIFHARTPSAADAIVNYLITDVTKFAGSTKGDRYLFVTYDYATNQFSFRPFVY